MKYEEQTFNSVLIESLNVYYSKMMMDDAAACN